LFCYHGYGKPTSGNYHYVLGDNFMFNFAAAMTLLVVVFQTSTQPLSDNFRAFVASDNKGHIHYAAAVPYFLSLAVISFVNFKRTKNSEMLAK
jgi:hypothetical protein